MSLFTSGFLIICKFGLFQYVTKIPYRGTKASFSFMPKTETISIDTILPADSWNIIITYYKNERFYNLYKTRG